MKKGVFIQSDKKQLLGAKIAKYAMETRGGAEKASIPVTIMLVENMPVFTKFSGMTYRRGDEIRTHDEKDLQFFTLSRFMPPELMNYEGRAIVIDPDIFALSDVTELFSLDLKEARLAACRKKDAWDSSVMMLACNSLTDWNIEKILTELTSGNEDYRAWMQLRREKSVLEIPRKWNSLDHVDDETKMLHTTVRLTQPWKTGLPIDFIPGRIPKLFGFVPRFWIHQETHYQKHPNQAIESLFFELAREALEGGAFTNEEVTDAIEKHYIRKDFFEMVSGGAA